MKHQPVERQVYSVVEASRLFGVSRGEIYKAVASGELPSIRVGKMILLTKAEIHRLLGLADSAAA